MTKWASLVYDQNTKFTTPLPSKEFLFSLSKDVKILDVGCGYGRTLNYLRKLGFRNITGFDVSPSYVTQARKNCPEAKVFVSSFKNFNPKHQYDVILLMGVIEYILTDEDQILFFDKVSNSLSQNGYILLETFIMDLKSNWKQYLSGLIKTLHFGRFKNSKGFECHHQSSVLLNKILQQYFIIEQDAKRDYLTWTNNTCKGRYFILKKK